MLETEIIKDLLANPDLSNRDKLLICLAKEPIASHTILEIKTFAISLGLRSIKSWNVSSYLAKAKALSIRTTSGWELTSQGKQHVANICGPILPSVTILVVSSLRSQLPNIASINTRAFVDEAIRALESKLYRSAIVLSWVGAVSVLYEHIISNSITSFNTEAARRDNKWKNATTIDDLTKMKEHEFLQVLVSISVIGKNVKDELEVCLKLRNGCGHPNSLIVGEHKASAHIETLIQNVFTKF